MLLVKGALPFYLCAVRDEINFVSTVSVVPTALCAYFCLQSAFNYSNFAKALKKAIFAPPNKL